MPEIAGLITAVAALLVIFAWTLIFGRALAAMRSHVPGLFLPLFDALASADAAVYNALRGWADPAVQPFSDLLGRVSASIDALTTNPLQFARNVYAAIQRLFTVEIPFAISTAAQNAAILFRQAEADAQALYGVAEQQLATLAAELASLPAQLQDLSQLLTAYALGLAQQVQSYAAGLFQQAESDAGALVGQEAARAYSAEQAVASEAAAATQALESSLYNEVRRFESQLGTFASGLESEVQQAKTDLGAEIVNFEDLVKQRVEAAVLAYPEALLGRLGEEAKRTLQADVEAIVVASLNRLRQEIKDVDNLRRQYAPAVQAEIEKIKARLA